MTMYGFLSAGTALNALILYSFRYKVRLPWHRVIGRMCTVITFFTFFYYTSPGYRRYSKALISISKTRKNELLHIFDP